MPHSVNVLVFDDEDDIRLLVTTAVRATTAHAVLGTASDEAEALALAATVRADLIVTDSIAGQARSGEYLKALRAAAPEAHIIVFSGYPRRTFPPDAPYDDFVLKGDGVRRLVAAIEAGTKRQ